MINDNPHQRVTGFNCPVCTGLIPVSSPDITCKKSIICPTCSLELVIKKEESKQAIDILNHVEQAQKNIDQVRTFS